MTKTAQQWLALPEAERGVALAEVLTPGPWRHEFRFGGLYCKRCNVPYASFKQTKAPCPVPDPIVIDWNTAMEWFRKSHECFGHLREMYFIVCQEAVNRSAFPWWLLYEAQPYHYLVGAAMAQEGQG